MIIELTPETIQTILFGIGASMISGGIYIVKHLATMQVAIAQLTHRIQEIENDGNELPSKPGTVKHIGHMTVINNAVNSEDTNTHVG